MPEWWTYSLADFLMFSPAVYWRLFELENLRVWPYQAPALLAGLAVSALVLRSNARSRRAALLLLAAAWLLCAWRYFHRSYATIHTFGNFFAVAFALQAAALVGQAAVGLRSGVLVAARTRVRAGAALCAAAVVALPLALLALGRPLAQTEVFGFMPDPTVLATLGALLALRGSSSWLLLLPFAWSAYSALTLYTLGSAAALLPCASALIVCACVLLRWRERRFG